MPFQIADVYLEREISIIQAERGDSNPTRTARNLLTEYITQIKTERRIAARSKEASKGTDARV